MSCLTNKTALVTGASHGIGRATAQALAKEGAHVIVHYGRSAGLADSYALLPSLYTAREKVAAKMVSAVPLARMPRPSVLRAYPMLPLWRHKP